MDSESNERTFTIHAKTGKAQRSIRINWSFTTFGHIKIGNRPNVMASIPDLPSITQILNTTKKNSVQSDIMSYYVETFTYSRFLTYVLSWRKVSAYGKRWLDNIIQTYKSEWKWILGMRSLWDTVMEQSIISYLDLMPTETATVLQHRCFNANANMTFPERKKCNNMVHVIIQHVMFLFHGTTMSSWTCHFYEKKFYENMYSHILFI